MTGFPHSLKTWRKARRFSQLDLALEADVSARHISFLETGRARPSRDMIGRLGDALELPLDARNQMLTHAGFAARYPQRAWDDAEMAPIRGAIDHMLDCHAPYPAIALDRLWSLVRMNTPAENLFGLMGIGEGDSLLDLLVAEELSEVIENWPEVAHHTARRLRTESAAQGGIPALDRVADHLSRVPEPDTPTLGPVVPAIYRAGDLRLALFATIAQFGTPEDLLLDDLRIELFFPADTASEVALRSLAKNYQ
ncbi:MULTISPECIES: helix-turn-helix domain-containing protein [unclassified Roseovarius]|uniref:helix-turn-helix domain-containing protein n=1 Tax=unclassified Roseovarius TaxID=2614913 RepID=UPI00273FDD0C|nr:MULTISPECIES: helix-turn-helix transcriptional regulator [unclassified Roseovarius]